MEIGITEGKTPVLPSNRIISNFFCTVSQGMNGYCCYCTNCFIDDESVNK